MFAFVDHRPLCSECQRRSARVRADGSWYRRCGRCIDGSRGKNGRAERAARRRVFLFLGGRCSCRGQRCWHPDACPVDSWDALTIDHQHQNGAADRRSRTGKYSAAHIWQRYLRRLSDPNHGLRILCANCHHVLTRQMLRAARRSA